MRVITFDSGEGAAGRVLLGEEIVPASALDAPPNRSSGLLSALDADGLAALGERATERQRAGRARRACGCWRPCPIPRRSSAWA